MLLKPEGGRSLTRRLVYPIFAITLVAWTAVNLGGYYETREDVDELYNGELAQLASVMLTLYSTSNARQSDPRSLPQILPDPFEDERSYEDKLVLQVWDRDGKLLLRSGNAPLEPLSKIRQGFERLEILGHPVVVYTLAMPEEPYIVQVAQRAGIREDISSEILEVSRFTMLLSIPLLLLVLYLAIRNALKPLGEIEQEISARSATNLEPFPLSEAPVELRNIVSELNQLLARLQLALEKEKQLVANATHELRTPLAGIRSNVQLALRARDANSREKALARAEAGVVNTTRLAEQLLSLARADATNPQMETLQLSAIVKLALDDMLPAAREKDIRLEYAVQGKDGVHGSRELLYTLLRNLIDNAARYSPRGGVVKIDVIGLEQSVTVQIDDLGPGIPESARDKVFQRFYRLPGNDAPGSGLGLSVVRRVAELHGAEIELASKEDEPGLTVIVHFPPPRGIPGNAGFEVGYDLGFIPA